MHTTGDRTAEAASPIGTEVPPRAYTRPLLVAGEDADSGCGALRIAELLARRDRVNAHVLGVVRPHGLAPSLLSPADRDALEDGRRHAYLDKLHQRVHQTTGLAAFFTIDVVTGSPATALARAAREHGSELIIVGIESPGAPNRLATEDGALQVTRAADIPVLVVPESCARLPRRALVAMDFTPASYRAARAALPLLDHGAAMTLVYVHPDVDFTPLGRKDWVEIYDAGVAGLIESQTVLLASGGDVSVDSLVLRGDPAAVLLDHAQRGAVDLIAAGTHGQSAAVRHLSGSVSTALVRGAQCPVLVAPPPDQNTSSDDRQLG